MKLNSKQKALVRRYLIWGYKSTRESFERIERKTTQILVDEFVLGKTLAQQTQLTPQGVKDYAKLIEDFVQYVDTKRQDEVKLKYADLLKAAYHPQYVYLQNRLAAIEEAIVHFLGRRALKQIEVLFEEEFTRRILESKDH